MQKVFSKQNLCKLVATVALVAGLSFMLNAVSSDKALAATPDQQITVSVQGTTISETFTYADLDAAGMVSGNVTGYLYQKPTGEWYVVGAKNSVKLTDLLDAAGVSSYWGAGATIMYKTTDFPSGYDKYFTTYEETARDNLFYTAVGATGLAPLASWVDTPTVLAFDYSQTQIAEGSNSADTLAASTFVPGTRFCCGLTDDTVNGIGTTSMGKRMPTEITEIVIRPAA